MTGIVEQVGPWARVSLAAAALILCAEGPAPAAQDSALRGSLPASPPAAAVSKPAPTTGWSEADIATAHSECETLLKGLGLDFSYLPPLRSGQCGTPQPIELRGLGGTPGVKIDPAAIINCRMAATLAKWFTSSVQPLASTWLKSPVVSIRNAASYDCRNRYGDPKEKLSEHAKANALDILSFTTAKGATVAVLDSWGPILRVLLQGPALPAPTKMNSAGGFATTVQPAAPAPSQKMDPPDPAAAVAKAHLGSQAIRQARLVEAARRGIAVPQPSSPEAKFVHAVHDSACQMFGTVLGPEANDAHKDHLHVDLAARPGSAYCE